MDLKSTNPIVKKVIKIELLYKESQRIENFEQMLLDKIDKMMVDDYDEKAT